MPTIPRPERTERTDESAIQSRIRERLGREPELLLFRNAQAHAEIWDENTGKVRHARGGLGVGTPDLVGLIAPAGRFFALEVKSELGRVSQEQAAVAHLIRSRGGFVAVVVSVEEALAAYERARTGART